MLSSHQSIQRLIILFFLATLSAAYANAAAHVRTGPTEFAITFDENAEAGKAGSFNVLGDVAAKVCFPYS